jgi:Leucine-rich repeat (LRR) protein
MTPEEAVRRIERVAEEKLIELDLSGLELKELPPEIAKCTQLETLSLSDNQITAIPGDLGQLSNLTELDRAWKSDYLHPRGSRPTVQPDKA